MNKRQGFVRTPVGDVLSLCARGVPNMSGNHDQQAKIYSKYIQTDFIIKEPTFFSLGL